MIVIGKSKLESELNAALQIDESQRRIIPYIEIEKFNLLNESLKGNSMDVSYIYNNLF